MTLFAHDSRLLRKRSGASRLIPRLEALESRNLLSTGPTIPFTINAPTNLISQGIYVAMFGSVATPVSNSKTINVQYDIEWNASGAFQKVAAGSPVEVEKLAFTGNTSTVQIPDVPNGAGGLSADTYQLNGARLVFGIGNQPYLPVSSTTSVAAPSPATLNDPNTSLNYDFVEFTLDAAGMHINTTTVDQLGFPVTVAANKPTGSPSISPYITSNGVGVQLDRQDVFDNYPPFIQDQNGTGTPFLESLVDGNTSAGTIYLPSPAGNYLSAHSGTGAVTITAYNVSSSNILAVNFGAQTVQPASVTFDPTSDVATITVTPPTPTLANSTVDVTLTTTGGTSLAYPFDDYYQFGNRGAPTVTGISASQGPTAGGTELLINGTNLLDPNLVGANCQVLFGTTPATFTLLSTTQIEAVVPPAPSAGPVKITVENNGQTATNTPSFTYVAGLPTVTQVAPNVANPGATITVTGTNLTGATAVNFGAAGPGANIKVISATELTVTAPASGSGSVDVTVTTPQGTSPVTPDDQFRFFALPTYSATSSLRIVNPSDILAIEANPPVTLYAKCEPGGNLTTKQIYYYEITATNTASAGAGESVASNVQNAQAGGIPGYDSIVLTWAPFLNATGYNVYRATSSTGPFQLIAQVNGANTTSFLDNGSSILSAHQPPTSIYTYDTLAWYFNANIGNFFNYYAPKTPANPAGGHTFSLTYGGITYSGTTVTPNGSQLYTYLHLQEGTSGTYDDIYEPFFNSNTNIAGAPAPPSWLATKNETPGQMVLAGNGVFAESATGGNAGTVGNILVAAFNRGIATNFAVAPSNWGKSPNFYYHPGSIANYYAAYMHVKSGAFSNVDQVSISDNRPSTLGGPQPLAYGFSYDDQAGDGGAGYGSYFTTPASSTINPIPVGTIGITITLGSWAPPSGVQIVTQPNSALIGKPVNFLAQLIGASGSAAFIGGQTVSLQVIGPGGASVASYTLTTLPNGSVGSSSLPQGYLTIDTAGNYYLKFSLNGTTFFDSDPFTITAAESVAQPVTPPRHLFIA